ncbi:rCG45190 [Rattus norvegicus]|uniref:RCG45190 n=1 Tax=Rattus norvegicus TaxID=10116 RepID=A6KLN3_RAT|nr:rCG45190 [Rattus norvegicus]
MNGTEYYLNFNIFQFKTSKSWGLWPKNNRSRHYLGALGKFPTSFFCVLDLTNFFFRTALLGFWIENEGQGIPMVKGVSRKIG